MKKLLIAIGTTSEQKINYLKEILRELKIKAEIIPIQIESKISNQPKSTKETKQGSINRAKESLKQLKEVDFAIGIEVGYHKNNQEKYEMFCWVTIVDKNSYQLSSQSDKFLLPKYHQAILKTNKYLGDNLDEYIKKSKNLIKKYIDNIIRYRKPFIESALKKALISYLSKEDF
jgi:non-canonical (house-cleaning) NTP pyrophosphatase